MATKRAGKKKPSKGVATRTRAAAGSVGRKRTHASDSGGSNDQHDAGAASTQRLAAPRRIAKPGIIDGVYGDGDIWGHTFISGPTGSGKTYEADRLVGGARRLVKFIPPNATFDPQGMPVFRQPGELKTFLAARTGDRQARCCYQPAFGTDKDEHFEIVCRMVRLFGNVIFYVDEVDQFCTPNTMKPQGSTYWSDASRKGKRSEFDEMYDSGRHYGVNVVSLSRFPAQVARKITANSKEMRLFRQSEPNVIAYYADKIGRTNAERLAALGDYEYLLWQDGREPVVAGGRR